MSGTLSAYPESGRESDSFHLLSDLMPFIPDFDLYCQLVESPNYEGEYNIPEK
jgi:hypothetical protein